MGFNEVLFLAKLFSLKLLSFCVPLETHFLISQNCLFEKFLPPLLISIALWPCVIDERLLQVFGKVPAKLLCLMCSWITSKCSQLTCVRHKTESAWVLWSLETVNSPAPHSNIQEAKQHWTWLSGFRFYWYWIHKNTLSKSSKLNRILGGLIPFPSVIHKFQYVKRNGNQDITFDLLNL